MLLLIWYLKLECLNSNAGSYEKTLEKPLDCKDIKPINPKGNQSWIFIGRTDAGSWNQYFDHLMRRTDSLEKTLMLGKIEGRRRRDNRGWDGWMASPTRWTWVWVAARSWLASRETWRAAVHGVAKSWTQLSHWTELHSLVVFPMFFNLSMNFAIRSSRSEQ